MLATGTAHVRVGVSWVGILPVAWWEMALHRLFQVKASNDRCLTGVIVHESVTDHSMIQAFEYRLEQGNQISEDSLNDCDGFYRLNHTDQYTTSPHSSIG